MKKRMISFLLAIVMVLGLIPVSAITAEAASGDYAFTAQPVNADTIVGEKTTVTWKVNFTPVRQRLLKIQVHPVDGEIVSFEELSASAQSVALDGGYPYYAVRSYYSASGYVTSEKFTVTKKVPFTADSVFSVGKTVEVDLELLAESSESWMEDYLDEAIMVEWFVGGSKVSGAADPTYTIRADDAGKRIYAVISGSTQTIQSFEKTILSGPVVYVGGVGMNDGDYLAVGATKTTTTKPSGGYAYYKDGKLTLNNYSYEGQGYLFNDGRKAAIFCEQDLNVVLAGSNTLNVTGGNNSIYTSGIYGSGNVTINAGTGASLVGQCSYIFIRATNDLTINGGSYLAGKEDSSSFYPKFGFCAINGGITMSDCSAELIKLDNYAFTAESDISLTDCNMTVTGGNNCFTSENGNITITGGILKSTTRHSFAIMESGAKTLTVDGAEIEAVAGTSGVYTLFSYGGSGLSTLVMSGGVTAVASMDGGKTWETFNPVNQYKYTAITIGATPHGHILASEYTANETHHWKQCADPNCPDLESSKTNYAEHKYSHDADADCDTCKYTRVPPHQHIYSEEYNKEAYGHWRECTDPACPVLDDSVKDLDYHTFNGRFCSVCGYEAQVFIGGIELKDGDYLAATATTTTKTKPGDLYAYYKDGVLTLHNFQLPVAVCGDADAITMTGVANIVLEGVNILNSGTDCGIRCLGSTLRISGDGSLNIESYAVCLDAEGEVIVENASLTLHSKKYYCIYVSDGLTLKNCSVSGTVGNDDYEIISGYGDFVITGSTVTSTGGDNCIEADDSLTITDSIVNATGARNAIYSGSVVMKDSTVILTELKGTAVWSNSTITVTGCHITVEAPYGFYTYTDGKITISDSEILMGTKKNAIDTETLEVRSSNVLITSSESAVLKAETVKYSSNVTVTASTEPSGINSVAFDPADMADYYYVKFEAQGNGWVQVDGAWYYYENGAPKTGWHEEGGRYYYFRPNGVMATGWEKIGEVWYYMEPSGARAVGWQLISGDYYYFYASGVMKTGWLNSGGKRYFFRPDGAMATGWVQYGGKWYCMDESGAMMTGWIERGGKKYYLQSDGVMVTGTVTIGGEVHQFDENGVWQGKQSQSQNGWVKEGGKWCYYKNGVKVTGWLKDGGKWYYFDANGIMMTGWVKVGSTWYYMTGSGAMHTGWLQLDGKWYYMNSSGAMVTGTVTIDGVTYKFSSSGVWIG